MPECAHEADVPVCELPFRRNHLPAAKLAADPAIKNGCRVIVTASDDTTASAAATALIEELGYVPVSLGTLAEGAVLT